MVAATMRYRNLSLSLRLGARRPVCRSGYQSLVFTKKASPSFPGLALMRNVPARNAIANDLQIGF